MRKPTPAIQRAMDAAERLSHLGKTPTYELLREELGGASYNTISQGLKLWRSKKQNNEEEARLKQQQQTDELVLFRNLVDQSSDSLYIVDPVSGHFLDANEIAYSHLGYTRDDFLRLHVLDISTHISNEQEWHALVKNYREHDKQLFETKQRKKDGSLIPVELNARLYSDGTDEYLICSCRDITDRKRLSDDLNESREQLKRRIDFERLISEFATALIDLQPTSVDRIIGSTLKELGLFANADRSYLFQTNDDDLSFRCSHEWCRSGIAPQIESLENCLISDFLPFIERLERGKALELKREELSDDAGVLTEIFDAGNIQSIINVPLHWGGQWQGFIGFDSLDPAKRWSDDEILLLRVITQTLSRAFDHWHSEAQYRFSEKRANQYLQVAGVMMMALNDKAEVSLINQKGCELLGCDESEILGRNWCRHFIPESDREEVDRNFSRLLQDDEDDYDLVNDIRVLHRDGTVRWVSCNVTLLRNQTGKVIGTLSSGEDITKRKQMEAELRLSEEKFRAIFENVPIGIVILDAKKFTPLSFNSQAHNMLGYTRQEFRQLRPMDAAFDESNDEIKRHLARIRDEGHESFESMHKTKDGKRITLLVNIESMLLHDQPVLINTFVDISEQKRVEQALQQTQQELDVLAFYDPLTNLPNQRLFLDHMSMAMGAAQRDAKLLAVCHLDLDNFKSVNRSYGKEAGDQLLVAVAGRLSKSVRDGDTIARWGGDEYTLLLGGLNTDTECREALKRILKLLRRPYTVAGQKIRLTASIGVTIYPDDHSDADTLLRHAAHAMYLTKVNGRNNFSLFDVAENLMLQEWSDERDRLDLAIDADELRLQYQPKLNMRQGSVYGVEALVRWQHPEKGLLAHDNFLSEIKDHQLILNLDRWVLNQAVMQLSAWQKQNINLIISVNVSVRSLEEAGFVSMVKEVIDTHPNLNRDNLEFELIETEALCDIDRVTKVISELQGLGISTALDDFGTGFSSLTYLCRLPARILKIDQSFVRNMLEDDGDLSIVEGVISLARAFDRDVIAEGVESEAHGVQLLRLGCEYAQGYHIARPMFADDIPDWLQGYRPPKAWQSRESNEVQHDYVTLLSIEAEHCKWMHQIEQALLGDISFKPPALQSTHCRFGRWYYDYGHKRYGHMQSFRTLEKYHDRVHELSNQLIDKHYGKHTVSQEEMDELNSASEDLLKQVSLLLLDSAQP
ncbi:MAG: EAL domain-containing protein [Pseudomonadota bacterium]